jgi:hypothetical protein
MASYEPVGPRGTGYKVDRRRLANGTAAAAAVFALAACTGHSTGVTAQSGPVTAPATSAAVASSTSPSAVATPTASAASMTPRDSSSPPVVKTSTTTTPSVTGSPSTSTPSDAGKAALAAFLAFERTYAKAAQNPSPANQAAVVSDLTSPSVAGISDDLANQRAGGLVYKGTPDDPRVHVVTPLLSSTHVFLRSCPLVDRKSPFLPYFAATGKPAVPATARSGPRWWADITVVKVSGAWKIQEYFVDKTQPCSA